MLATSLPLLDALRVTGPAIDVRTPFDGSVLYALPTATPDDVTAAAQRARRAQGRWAQTPLPERVAIALRFHDLVLGRREEAMDILQWETGKARRDALEEVLDVCVTTRHYARSARRLLRSVSHRGALPLVVGVREHRHPRGLVGVIAPWNYPLTLAASDAIPALLAGNAVLVKPDPQTSLIAAWVARLLSDAGVPDDVFTVVPGDGAQIGSAVVDAVDHVMFTGSTATGRLVARRCGERLIGCSLELGGKNALMVRADADLARAAEVAVRASFANTGQLCISMERLYVHESVHEEFLARFLPRVMALRIGTRPGWGADVGPLINAMQFERVRHHVDDAVAGGATVLAGGRARPDLGPFAYEPTVLAHVREGMAVCRDETFGPVAAVYPVAHDDEAVARANDSAYGLNAAILTRDVRAGRRMAARIRAGSVNVNEGYAASWGSTAAPMGGMGDSGLGRRHGVRGLLDYTEEQTVATQRALGFGPPSGLSDEQWGQVLATAVGAIKRLGFR